MSATNVHLTVWRKLSTPEQIHSLMLLSIVIRFQNLAACPIFNLLLICKHSSKKRSFCHGLLVCNTTIMIPNSCFFFFWTPVVLKSIMQEPAYSIFTADGVTEILVVILRKSWHENEDNNEWLIALSPFWREVFSSSSVQPQTIH